jgi:hypothetical protein
MMILGEGGVVEFRHTWFIKTVFYTSIPVLCYVFILFMYRFSRAIIHNDYTDFPILLIGLLALYLVYASIRLLTYLNATILIHENGFTICYPGKETFYPWEESYFIKESTLFQLFEVYDKNHHRILMVDHMMPGYELFREMMKEKINSTEPASASIVV